MAPGPDPLARAKVWFEKDEAFDREAGERFATTLDVAMPVGCDARKATPCGRPASSPLMHAEDAAAQARCVERFGRFPHRNAILGRATTPEEAELLKVPGSSF